MSHHRQFFCFLLVLILVNPIPARALEQLDFQDELVRENLKTSFDTIRSKLSCSSLAEAHHVGQIVHEELLNPRDLAFLTNVPSWILQPLTDKNEHNCERLCIQDAEISVKPLVEKVRARNQAWHMYPYRLRFILNKQSEMLATLASAAQIKYQKARNYSILEGISLGLWTVVVRATIHDVCTKNIDWVTITAGSLALVGVPTTARYLSINLKNAVRLRRLLKVYNEQRDLIFRTQLRMEEIDTYVSEKYSQLRNELMDHPNNAPWWPLKIGD